MVCATFRMRDVKTVSFVLGAVVLVLCATLCTYRYLTRGVVRLSTYSDRVQYLENLEVPTDSIVEESKGVTIPVEFDDTYEQYAQVQTSKGLPDLHAFKGERATVYDYTLQDGSSVQLLVCDGILVGSYLDSNA